jgi:chemotaxis protein CheZ
MAGPTTMNAKLESRLAALGKPGAGVDPADIAEVVESVLGSISGDKSGINVKLHEDIEALAKFIAAAKADISSLRADEINSKFIPTASNELTAIVGATEHATNEIFEAVDAIEAACAEMEPEAAAPFADAVTRIYEACSFQDITGQRITKIVKVLQDVEDRVSSLLEVFGEQVPERKPEAAGPKEPAPDVAPEAAADEELMNGPQLPANAMSQEDIDALMASFD